MKKLITPFLFTLIFFCNANAQKSLIDSSYGRNGTSFFTLPGGIISYSQFVKELKDNRTLIVYQTKSISGHPDTINIVFADDKGNIIQDGDSDARALALPLADYGFKNSILEAINQQPDGKILITGTDDSGSSLDYLFVLRCMPDGSVDKSFGENGMVKQAFYGKIINGYGVVIDGSNSIETDSKNRILLSMIYSCECSNDTLMLLRFLPDGKIDNDFGADGIARVYSGMGSYGGYINQLVILPDDKILTCGDDGLRDDQDPANKNKFVIIRFNADGSVDSSFGVNGRSFNYYNIKYDNVPWFIRLDRNNKIVVGGNYTINQFRYYENLGVVRLNTDGSADNEFGTDSRLIIDYPGYSLHGTQNLGDNLGDMEVQENGKILFGATLTDIKLDPTIWDGIVYRFNEDGSHDISFADSGIYQYSFVGVFDTVDTKDSLNQMELKRDGDILLYGSFSSTNGEANYNYKYLTRLNGDPVKNHPTIAQIKRWIIHHILHFTDTNPGTAYYAIEQKTSSENFKQVATVNARSSGENNYTFNLATTNAPSVTNAYRIKAVQNDGSAVYSNVFTDISDNTAGIINVSPNPAKDVLTIQGLHTNMQYEIRILNKEAIQKSSFKILSSTNYKTDISALQSGIYFLEIKDNEGKINSLKFVKE